MLLRSPFLRIGQKEAGRLDCELRRAGADEVGLAVVRPHFREFAEAARGLPSRQRFSQWSADFSRLLHLAGWPYGRTLSSAEYQALEHWKKLLSAFARLDVDLTKMEAAVTCSADGAGAPALEWSSMNGATQGENR